MTIRQTDNKELASKIRQALKDNNGYCPCMVKQTEDTKCMCKNFRKMEEGTCYCGLYNKTKD